MGIEQRIYNFENIVPLPREPRFT